MRNPIVLTDAERGELNQRAASRSGRADDARRARLILLLESGRTWATIRDKLDCNDAFIDRWSQRFRAERLAGLFSRHAGQEASTLTPALEARILKWTLQRKPSDGSTQWSTRKLGAQLQISHMMVARVWAQHGLKPHRLDRYLATKDPDFEKKAADVIGLYLNPPAHAAVFCVDEKTAIQALDRKDPVLPLSPGRAERHGFEYFRHGTLSLYAAFNTRTGKVLGKTAGANVTPREVEVVIESFPEVVSAFVVGLPDPVRGQNVAAAVVLKRGAALDADTARARLREQLSSYKVPRQWLFAPKEELPFTDSGKIDKKRLAALLAERLAQAPR